MANKSLAELGRELDDAERAERATDSPPEELKFARYAAKLAYERAQDIDAWARFERFRAMKRTPTNKDADALRSARWRAEQNLEDINEVGWEFRTVRELCDAHTEAWLAYYKYIAAQDLYQDAQRQRRADARAGIVRVRSHRKR